MRAILLWALLLQLLVGCDSSPSTWPVSQFDSAAWRRTKEENRYVFTRDLIESRKLIGRSKQQVIDLLGRPSYDSPEDDYMTFVVRSDNTGVFIMGIRFYKNGAKNKVTSVFVRGK